MIKKILPYLLAALMLLGAYGHIANPDFYGPMVPAFIPLDIANWISVVVEAAIGIGLIIPSTRKMAARGFFILMIVFLPIHIWDVIQETPVVGSRRAALIRLLVQFLLIYAGWYVQRSSQAK
ncbi:MAG TPA: hypothetical protein VJ953_06820 [Saprospiraceae bacterium]|nr:hypothetical protein [Saprospiraceae bacterium]